MESRFLLSLQITGRMFQFSVLYEKCVAAWHYGVIGKQLFISNYRHSVRWEVLGLSQDGVCTDSFKNFIMESLKRDQSNDTHLTHLFFLNLSI